MDTFPLLHIGEVHTFVPSSHPFEDQQLLALPVGHTADAVAFSIVTESPTGPSGPPKSEEVRIGVDLSTTAQLRHAMVPDIIPSMILCHFHDGCLHVVTVISKFGRKITNPLFSRYSSTDPNWHSRCCSQQRYPHYG